MVWQGCQVLVCLKNVFVVNFLFRLVRCLCVFIKFILLVGNVFRCLIVFIRKVFVFQGLIFFIVSRDFWVFLIGLIVSCCKFSVFVLIVCVMELRCESLGLDRLQVWSVFWLFLIIVVVVIFLYCFRICVQIVFVVLVEMS